MFLEVLRVNNNADNINTEDLVKDIQDDFAGEDTPKSIEDNFSELEEIIKDMQSEDITLDKSFDLYHRGIKLVQNCNNQIDTIEKKIKILEEDSFNE